MSRLVLIAAIAVGVSYVGSWFLPLPQAAAVAWKGGGVALLAAYVAASSRGASAWVLAAVMAFGALGDVLLETHGLVVGALAFLAGHVTAVGLYLRNRRSGLIAVDWTLAAALLAAIPVAAFFLPPQREGAGLVALYATGLSAMTAAAWLSRFPRPLTAAGAMLFALSDLLIFLRTGRPGLDTFPLGLAVWSLYFAGQTLIVLGVTRGLPRRTS